MSGRRVASPVVITGRGLVSPLAAEAGDHLRRLFRGDSAVAPWPDFLERGLPVLQAGAVGGFAPRARIRDRMLRKLLQPSAAFAVGAAGEALRDAGLRPRDPMLVRCGLYVGSVSFELAPDFFAPALRASFRDRETFDIDRFCAHGMPQIDPLLIVKGLPNAALSGIAIEHRVEGATANFANGSASGLEAVSAAYQAIRAGDVELALAGGADSLLELHHVIEHTVNRGLTLRDDPGGGSCRPFDRTRTGYLPGQGAAFVVVESAAHARHRGATVLAELRGVGEATALEGSDAGGEALDHAARSAVGVRGEPDAIFGHGLATPADDAREAAACRRLFGRPAPITAATGAVGNTGAAGGPLALVHAVEALRRQRLPPTAGCRTPDPRLGLDVVVRPRAAAIDHVLVWCSDRGLKNVAMAVGGAP